MANVETPVFPTLKEVLKESRRYLDQLPIIGPEIIDVDNPEVDIKLVRQHELMASAQMALKRFEVGRLVGVLRSQIK